MIPTNVADVSCHAVSPEFSQLGSGFRAASIARPHLCFWLGSERGALCRQSLSAAKAPFFSHSAHIGTSPYVHRARVTPVTVHRHLPHRTRRCAQTAAAMYRCGAL